MTSYRVISAANFVAEPRDLFESGLLPHLRFHCPHVFRHPDGGEGWAWTSETPRHAFGWDFIDERERLEHEPRWTFAELPQPAVNPEAHLASMNAAGIDAAIVYPLALVEGYRRLGPEIRRAALSTYNRWMAQEFEPHDPSRMIGPRLLPSEDSPRSLLRSLEQLAGTGARAVFLPSMVSLDAADGDAFWRDIADADLTVCLAAAEGRLPAVSPTVVSNLITAHPKLRIVVVPVHPVQDDSHGRGPGAQAQLNATLFDADAPTGVPMYCAHFPRRLVPLPEDHEFAAGHASRAFHFADTSRAPVHVPRSVVRLRVDAPSVVVDEQDGSFPAIGIALGGFAGDGPTTVKTIAESARRIEAAGFAGVWVGDAIARRPGTNSLDPFMLMAVAATATDDIELGTCIVQVPLRRRVELAHRALSLYQVTSRRFTFGVGAGSTHADFDAVGVPFEERFRELRQALPEMKALWRGEKVGAACLYPRPEVLGGPPVLVGSWGGKWVEIAAREADGWIASGTRTWRTLADAVQRFKKAGGQRAVVSTVVADLSVEAESPEDDDRVHLACSPDEAIRRLRRLGEMGFTDVIVNNLGPPETLPILAALGNRSSGQSTAGSRLRH
jgi:alkanesulfonate monooxygenase SsuD/methylene tetrahydromethanopterin reductase-like flavin-dependent oxidoreductase (luciferase family)